MILNSKAKAKRPIKTAPARDNILTILRVICVVIVSKPILIIIILPEVTYEVTLVFLTY